MEDAQDTQGVEVAPQVTEAPSEQAAPANDGAISPEQPGSDTEPKLYAGKYKTPQELEKAYENAQALGTRSAQEAAELRRMIDQQNQQQQSASAAQAAGLDPEVVPALDSWYEQRRSKERAEEFVTKHHQELQDPMIDAQVRRELENQQRQYGRVVDFEGALTNAKAILDERLSVKSKEAKTAGVKEGQEVAQRRAEAAAVGDTAAKSQKNDADLSAAEIAAKYNLPRA